MSNKIIFEPINIEHQNQIDKYKFISKITVNSTGAQEETGFIYQKFAGLAPKKFTKKSVQSDDIACDISSDKRDYVRILLDPEQKACIDLKNILIKYDEAFENSKASVFGKYERLYLLQKSITLKESSINSSINSSTESLNQILNESCIFNLDMGWNYYLKETDELLSIENTQIVKNNTSKFYNENKTLNKEEKKEKLQLLSIKLNLIDNNKIVEKDILMSDLKIKKNEISTKIFYRKCTDSNLKKPCFCSEEELIELYGEPKLLSIRTPDELDSVYNRNCYVRFLFDPARGYGNKNKIGDEIKRRAGIQYIIKSIDIIQIPYEFVDLNKNELLYKSINKKDYSKFSFGKKT